MAFVQAGMLGGDVTAGGGEADDILVVRLVHPDRQSAALLKLFEGTRAKHPAGAMAAWKSAPGPARDLGKPLEALIAFFNPEMANEWRVMHGARLFVNWDAARGRPAWNALVPGDDGTIAAAVTSARLSDGGSEPSLEFAGNQIAVERLGRSGASVAARAGEALVLGSSRDELGRAIRSLAAGGDRPEEAGLAGSGEPLDSGVSFALDASRLASERSLPVAARVAGEFLRGLSSRRLQGTLALKGDCLGLDVATLVRPEDAASAALWNGTATIDPAWLESVPSSGAMAVATLAFRPSREFWDSAFALANRMEKTDPARAELAPLRTRLNLLGRTAGIRLEADVWPHLVGLTVAILGEPSRPGRPSGVFVALHLDAEEAARHLVSQPQQGLAKAIGRDVTTWCKGRDLFVAWGNGVATAAHDAAARRELSVAPACSSVFERGKPAPLRLVVFWPARCWPLEQGLLVKSPAWPALADDPPAFWLGWKQESTAFDSIRWPGLERRVHRFLEQIALAN